MRPRQRWAADLVTYAVAAIAIVACQDTVAPRDRAVVPSSPHQPSIFLTKQVLPFKDTWIRSENSNQNYGANDSLRLAKVGTSDANRILIQFNKLEIADSIGSDQLVSATVELPIQRSAGWGSGRYVGIHRITQSWTELGATWNCAIDSNVGNTQADCPNDSWLMNGTPFPFALQAIDSALIRNGQTGVVTFNVTSNVQAFLAGQVSYSGWLLKRSVDSLTGNLVVKSRESTNPPRLILTISHITVPSQAPSTVPAWVYSDTNIASSGTSAIAAPFTKRIVIVEFKPTATAFQRDSAISVGGGTVIGGSALPNHEGHYYVRLEDTVGSALLAAARQLRAMPQVASAFVNVAGAANYALPADGPKWATASDWALTPATLSPLLQTWALTMINAPLAWGCSVGSTSTRMAVVDLDFLTTGADFSGMSLRTGVGTPQDKHGAGVSALMAAKGNDGTTGMTGVMWRADVRLYDASIHPLTNVQSAGFAQPIALELEHAGFDSAQVINISHGIRFGSVVSGSGDSTQRNARDEWHSAMYGAIQTLNATGRNPLVVVAAGNDKSDAQWNGSTLIKNDFPKQVLVVGAMTSSNELWWTGGSDGSNTGSLVDVVAPGENVYTYGSLGTITNARSGTSLAAPLVSGIAGLLFSFDPRLTADTVRKLIKDGALVANRKVLDQNNLTYYVADAYQSLKLAAERTTAPLCGNRMWTIGDSLFIERGTVFNVEKLVRPGSSGGFVTTYHDGHYLDLGGSIEWQNGAWVAGPPIPPTTKSGTYWSGSGTSHDGTDHWYMESTAGPPNWAVTLYKNGISVRTYPGSGLAVAASPIGDALAIPINSNPGFSPAAIAVHVLNLKTGNDTVLIPSIPNGVFAPVITEDGKELMFWNIDSPSATTCSVQVRSMTTGQAVQPPIVFPLASCPQRLVPSAIRERP